MKRNFKRLSLVALLAVGGGLATHAAGLGIDECYRWSSVGCCSQQNLRIRCELGENIWFCSPILVSNPTVGQYALAPSGYWDTGPFACCPACQYRAPICGASAGVCNWQANTSSFLCADYPEPAGPEDCP